MMRPWKFWYADPDEVMMLWMVSPAGLDAAAAAVVAAEVTSLLPVPVNGLTVVTAALMELEVELLLDALEA